MDNIVAFIARLDPSSLGIGGIVGALVGALLNHWLAKSRGKNDRLASASKALRTAFTDELSKLKNSSDNAYDILEAAYQKHEMAVSEFASHLGGNKKRKFLSAWELYRSHPENCGEPFLEQYSKYLGDVNLAAKNRCLAVERITRLLSFAKHT